MAGEISDLQHYTSYVGIISHDQYDDGGGTDGNGWRMAVKERKGGREERKGRHMGAMNGIQGDAPYNLLRPFKGYEEKSFIKRHYFVRLQVF